MGGRLFAGSVFAGSVFAGSVFAGSVGRRLLLRGTARFFDDLAHGWGQVDRLDLLGAADRDLIDGRAGSLRRSGDGTLCHERRGTERDP
jgi:hypothetical protein